MKTRVVLLLAFCTFAASGFAQNFEITGQVGGQINGGYDLSTSLFHRIEVHNGVNYGISAGYLLGEHYGVEFQWNRNVADTFGEPVGGGSGIRLFSLSQNQYMGNFLFHFTPRDEKVRPFVLVGLGANALDPDVSAVSGSTRFAFSLGGGVKYNISHYFGLRGQLKWTPTYLTTTNGGYWCDPIWGGCWVVGNSHYLHEFDIGGGITFRF